MKVTQGQTLLTCPRKNTDIRIKTAYDIYNTFDEDWIIIYKTTRAGCTTALVAEALNRHEKALVIVPTNNIAEKTVIADAKTYSDRNTTDIIHIPSNHKCIINEEMIEQWPDLSKLPILPLADKCKDCREYDTCPVTAILRGKGMDGCVLTYDKLAALMLASGTRPNTMAEDILNIILKSKNAIFDEIHELQYGKSVSLTVYDDYKKDKYIDLSKYISITHKFKYIASVIIQFKQFLEDTQTKIAILEAYQGAESEDYWKHKLSVTLENKYNEIDFLAGCDPNKALMGTYAEIIELTKYKDEYNLNMYDIISIYDMMRIILNEKIVIHSIRDRGKIKVNFVAVDKLYSSMIRSFVMSIQNKINRVMLTSATVCSHDYDKYFLADTKPKKVLFGPNGDPMNTNSKMLILADSKKYCTIGKNSRYNRLEEIIGRIKAILEMYGKEDCIIITLSIKEAVEIKKYLSVIGIEKDVTYYKSPDMMGVSAKARIMIAVGAAEKPANAFDAITDNKEESLVLREEALHCDTWQAWSRVKDPQGKETSIVFALGCSVEQCKNITTWGVDRCLKIDNAIKNSKKVIDVNITGRKINNVIVNKCKTFTQMLTDAEKFKQSKKVVTSKTQKVPIYYIIGKFKQNEVTISLESELLQLLINRDDVYAEQDVNGRYFKVPGKITPELLKNHIDGKITIGTYTLDTNNFVKWMCFDVDAHVNDDDTDDDIIEKQTKADYEKELLCNFLNRCSVPYILEASGTPHSYHIWIFLKPVEAIKARELGKAILKECGIKKMEVFPKQTKISKNSYGNLVKLPFATHRKNGNKSKILVDGVFVSNFDELKVGAIDISSYQLPEVKKNQCQKPVKSEGVRLIFAWALKQKLTDEEGHWMRIAITREYFNNGMKNPDDLANLFKLQPDFDFEISKHHVLSIIKDDMGCWKWSTLVDKCPGFVNNFNKIGEHNETT